MSAAPANRHQPPPMPKNACPPVPESRQSQGPASRYHNELPSLPKPGRSRRSRFLIGAMLALVLFCSWYALTHSTPSSAPSAQDNGVPVSPLQPVVEAYAAEYGISDHIDELMAIMHVESGGRGEDVFQSSESLGLPPNSLSREESIEQGCKFYASLLDEAKELGVDQDSVFQAYNFGTGYLYYVAQNGGHHTRRLAENFSKEYAQGRVVTYNNPIAVEANGGWRYDYGNMFYVDLIHQYLKTNP